MAAAGWLTTTAAASILGCSERHIRRMLLDGELRGAQDEGQWFVDPDCRPALRLATGRAAGGVTLAGDVLANLPEAKRAATYRRYLAVRDYQAALDARPPGVPLEEARAAWLACRKGDEAISLATILRWADGYRRQGIAGLVDKRFYTPQAADISPQAWEAFQSLYLTQSRHRVPAVYDIVAAQARIEGWAWPSLRTIRRRVQEMDRKRKLAGRDPANYARRCDMTIDRDWSRVPAMACWVADHRQLDVWIPRRIRDGERWRWGWMRPWLTLFLDARTWMPVAWGMRDQAPDGNWVMAVFCSGVREHGLPTAVYLDNGKDFRLTAFSGGRRRHEPTGPVSQQHVQPLLESLGVAAAFATPYNARAKVVEPWFRLLADRFDRAWATYCGNNTLARPERLDVLSDQEHAERLARAGLTLETLAGELDRWIIDDYAQRPSPAEHCTDQLGNPLSPAAGLSALVAGDWRPVRPADETMALLLMPSRPCVIDQGGLYIRPFGGHYWHDSLEDRRAASGRDIKRKVTYRFDPRDASRVFVFDHLTGRFLCIATPLGASHPLAAITGSQADQAQLATAIERQRHLANKYTREVRDRKPLANALLAAASQAAAKLGLHDNGTAPRLPAPAPVIKLVGQADQAAHAGQQQRAAAEAAERRRISADEFFARAATGTHDDIPARPAASVSPSDAIAAGMVDLATDGLDCRTTQRGGELAPSSPSLPLLAGEDASHDRDQDAT
jgi:hypothetical protein